MVTTSTRVEATAKEEEKEKRSRPPAPETAPLLVYFAHGKRGKTLTFCSITKGRKYLRSLREMRRKSCLMVSQFGWLLMKDWERRTGGGSGCFLLNPASMEVIQLPPLPPPSDYTSSPPYGYRCILSSPPTDPDSVLCFFDKNKQRALFCPLIQKQWVKTEYEFHDELDRIRDVVVCNGRVYGITFYDKLITIDFRPYPTTTLIKKTTQYDGMFFTGMFFTAKHSRALVESCGGLYLVYKVYTGRTRVIETFRIFKMDFKEMKWVPVKCLGDRAFFITDGGRSFSCSASESGGQVEGNSIYYVLPKDPGIYRFDLASKIITRNNILCGNLSSPWYEAYWVLLPSSSHD